MFNPDNTGNDSLRNFRRHVFCTGLILLAASSLPISAHADSTNHQQPEALLAAKQNKSPRLDPNLPRPTAEDLRAAFPDTGSMNLQQHMSTPLLAHLLVDQFEWRRHDGENNHAWELRGWLGYDYHRLWLRAEGERGESTTDQSDLQLLFGHAFARWWDVVAGIRHDFAPGRSQSFAAFGLQGLAPYWFETEATFFWGNQGQNGFRLEFEYEWLLSQRTVLQALLETETWARRDLSRGIEAGFQGLETGLRLRYEIRREFAPYLGIQWEQALGNTANRQKNSGEGSTETSLIAGLRFWF